MIKEALILAGGLGTMLRNVIGEIPKPMAPVGEKPFLEYLFIWLEKNGIRKAVVSVGYLSEKITTHFGNRFGNIEIEYCPEPTPLGTGGGIKNAFEYIDNDAYVLNGDTFFDIPLHRLKNENADISIALKLMYQFDRYGTVELNENNKIIAFNEKQPCESGLINGGIYYLRKSLFDRIETGIQFSFEKDILEKHLKDITIQGIVFDNYFIDIGIPEDYRKAQTDFH